MGSLLHRVSDELIQPESFLACIEISKGSKNKYEYDEDMDALRLDRTLYTSTHYPHNYGFIPRTWGLDNDPLDVLVISSEIMVPLSLVKCKPIGILEMIDESGNDEKIIAVAESDPFYGGYNELKELPSHVMEEIEHFFKVYKQLEHNKSTDVEGFEGREKAMKAIKNGKIRYKEKFKEENC